MFLTNMVRKSMHVFSPKNSSHPIKRKFSTYENKTHEYILNHTIANKQHSATCQREIEGAKKEKIFIPLSPKNKKCLWMALIALGVATAYQIKKDKDLNKNYHELTRRAPEIIAQLEKMDREKVKYGANLILKAGDDQEWWKNEIFLDQDYPYYALYCVKSGTLSVNDFANILCYWAAKNDISKSIEYISLEDPNNRGHANPKLVEEIYKKRPKATLEIKKEDIANAIEEVIDNSTNFQKIQFLLSLTKEDTGYSINNSCYQLFETKMHLLLFAKGNILENEMPLRRYDKLQVVPNLELHNKIIKTLFETPTIPNPVLGKSTLADIRQNGLDHQRDVGLPFPGIEHKEVDGFASRTLLCFTNHDLYHTLAASCIGKHTAALIEVAAILRQAAKINPENKKIYWRQAWLLEDMDHLSYRSIQSDRKSMKQKAFWEIINESISKLPMKSESDIAAKKYIIEQVAINAGGYRWEDAYDITLESLIQRGKRYEGSIFWGCPSDLILWDIIDNANEQRREVDLYFNIDLNL